MLLHSGGTPTNEPRNESPHDEREPRQVLYRTKWKVHQDPFFWIVLKSAQDKGCVFVRTICNAISNVIILNDSVPADCLVKVVRRKSHDILHHRTQSLPQAPKVVLRRVWQVQQRSTV